MFRSHRFSGRLLALLLALLLLWTAAACTAQPAQTPAVTPDSTPDSSETPDAPQASDPPDGLPAAEPLARKQLLHLEDAAEPVTASVAPYETAADLSNIVNLDQFYLSDAAAALLAENQFAVTDRQASEFFEIYEDNRYFQTPNFVTVDSMMHTYHLYFSLLLNRTEKTYLSDRLLALSRSMLEKTQAQYDALTGTEWEEAARINLAFFAVGTRLQDPSAALPEAAADLAQQELDLVYAAAVNEVSALTQDYVDYTQFQPRGYYEGDAVLEAYFRAMMWYGQLNFFQKTDVLNRSALLMILAMAQDLEAWETIYTVTSCFAGTSDDLGYYEYAPAIEAAYGSLPQAADLPENEAAYETYVGLIEAMDPPAINSVPVWQWNTADIPEYTKGFRFMGQRFTIDAAILQQLVYRNVTENPAGEQRLLPDVLDVPAALGSDLALELVTQQGAAEFPGYSENMEQLRTVLSEAPASAWSSSLYSGWLYTLLPVLEPKGEGYPSFMTSEAWTKKNLETFAGSYTELKHDTVLYAKQVMAEMGGGPMEEIDDRGYVEPEVEVYRRFAQLAGQTSEALSGLGLLTDADRENLDRLAQLAGMLQTISEKELRSETLTDEEYELIRGYGGTLEHFWIEAVKDKSESPYLASQEIPASLVTDIATDPNGWVLQVANGRPKEILVVVPIDGTLRLASGVVYDFYQFVQSKSDRLTDTAWRQMIGEWVTEDGTYNWNAQVEKPWWTESYRCQK